MEGSRIISEAWGDKLLIFLYDESGAPIGMQYRNTTYAANRFDTFYFEKNLQGDVVAVYNSSGIKVISYTYDAWGNHTVKWHDSYSTNFNASYNPFRYRGYYYDTDTGFYYLQSRYYNPQWGRFLNADGYVNANGDLIGFNMYTYCSNNPVMYADPTGHMAAEATVAATNWWNPAGWIAAAVFVVEVVVVAAVVVGAVALVATVATNVEDTATKVQEKVLAIPNIRTPRDQSVYMLVDSSDGNVKYIGRTNDPARRMYEHQNDISHPEREGYGMIVVATGLSRTEARTMEQTLISAFTLSYLDNARREISYGNLHKFQNYMSSISQILGGIPEDDLMNLMGR